MIYLGINQQPFTVAESDVQRFFTAGKDGEFIMEQNPPRNLQAEDIVNYKGFNCVVKYVHADSISLVLLTNNPNDYIPIVV